MRHVIQLMGWVVVLCALGSAAEAAMYHVSPSGSDSNPGSAAKPWKTIARANAAELKPGDRVLFEGGERFAGRIELGATDSGREGEPVEIGSYGKGRATIDGGNGSALVARGCSHLVIRDLEFSGSGRKKGNTERGVFLTDGGDVSVERVEIHGFRSSGLLLTAIRKGRVSEVYAHENGAAGISVEPGGPGPAEGWSEDITIRHCVAENNPGDPSNLHNHSGNGIVVGGVRDCLIEYCEAMDNGWDMPRKGNGPVGIWAWNADRVVIQFCVAHDNKSPGWDGGGFDFDGGVTNSIMQYNYSYNNVGPGYFLCQYPTGPVWKDNIIRYNVSVNDGWRNNVGCGIEVHGGDGRISDAEVYNNVVYNEKGGGVGFGGRPVPRVRFRNNIFVAAGEIIQGDASRARFEGNVYWSVDGKGAVARGHRTLEEWAEATGQEKRGSEVLGLFADPLLAKAGEMPALKPEDLGKLAAYRIRAGSPCIEAGIRVEDNGGRDFWGQEVAGDGKPTVGACEKP